MGFETMTVKFVGSAIRRFLVVAAILSASLLASAQSASFDAASIKPSRPDAAGVRPGSPSPGGRRSAANVPLLQIMQRAFDQYSRPGLIVGGPSWIRADKFDINAKAEGDPPRAQVLLMVQQLLRDRFKLRSHTEQRPVDTYALVKARSDGRLGPGLRPNPIDCRALLNAARGGAPGQGIVIPANGSGPCARHSGMSNGLVRFSETWLISQLIVFVESSMDRIVVDHTGLDGYYDINFEFDYATTRAPDGSGNGGSSIFTALQDQLGLKLESSREPMDVLVIDHLEQPTPD